MTNRLSPEDVARQSFTLARRGYAMDEVDAFLDTVVAELRTLQSEIAQLRASQPAEFPPYSPDTNHGPLDG